MDMDASPKQRTIVYVEDQHELLPLLQQVLRNIPVRIEWAPDVETGWALISELLPDLVVLDLMLPGEYDGWEICRRIHDAPELAKTRIIILSALGDNDVINRATPYPQVTDYLVKPYQIATLRGCLANALNL
jgi:two-component system phosphate regulon response regulator PhoB